MWWYWIREGVFKKGVDFLRLWDEVFLAATNPVSVMLASSFSFSFIVHSKLYRINCCPSYVILFWLWAFNLHKSTYFGLAHFFTSCFIISHPWLISRPHLQITNRKKGTRSKLQRGSKAHESWVHKSKSPSHHQLYPKLFVWIWLIFPIINHMIRKAVWQTAAKLIS